MRFSLLAVTRTILLTTLLLSACSDAEQQSAGLQSLTTIADARDHPAQLIDTGEPGDTVGDILIFDQPLLDTDRQSIGTNSGYCIRTRAGHSFQCQWTLSLSDGSIQVAGREFDQGLSRISIVGGTGRYAGIQGDMESVNNDDGTFTQKLRFE